MKHQAFILCTAAGQWAFQVHADKEEIGAGSGFADQFEAIDAARDAFSHLQLQVVVQPPPQVTE
jgi:hypothetical protein